MMAYCVPAHRIWFPFERVCLRCRCSMSILDGCRRAFMPKPTAAVSAFHGVRRRAHDSIRRSNFGSIRDSSCNYGRENYPEEYFSAASGISLTFNVAARSFHESQTEEQSLAESEHGMVGELSEYEEAGSEVLAEAKAKLKAGLYLVGTPIGNLEDITLRALRVLRSAALILAEDTRHSSRLLRHYDIRTPAMSYHKFNEIARRDLVLERLRRGEVLALISDAGMPGISDPGSDIVRACVEANVDVFPIPGPSAVVTALVASGLPTEEFSFVGFLPAQATSRHKRLTIAAKESATQVFYVPPHKLLKILDDCISTFGPSRRCAVARELTKLHEEFWRGTLDEAQSEFKCRSPRGEITLLVEGVSRGSQDQLVDEDELRSRLQSLLDAGKSPSEATKQVVLETSARKNLVYPLALSMSQKREF